MSSQPPVLRLSGSDDYPRQLTLTLWPDHELRAVLYGPLEGARMLAWASAPIDKCRMDIRGSSYADLWLGRAVFDLSGADAIQVREAFEARGLRTTVTSS